MMRPVTAKLVEDLFLADDLESLGLWRVADWICEAPTHDLVEEIRAGVIRVLAWACEEDL